MHPDTLPFLRDTIRDAIQLVAIWPDGPVVGHWFGNDATGAAQWAADTNAMGYNIYWTVNVARPGTSGKPSKEDISHARFVHVDIDPPRDDASWSIDTAIADIVPFQPSTLVASGGGLQALWRLDVSASAEDVEVVNKAIASVTGGDPACWNVDRLFRVPGTINYPSATKQARGRKPALAVTIYMDTGATRVLSSFPRDIASAPRERIDILPDYVLLTSSDLVPPPSQRLLDLIDRPRGVDRSADAYACGVELAKSGYDDATIVGVLMNPANAVHAHVGDHRPPERAAKRILERARENSPGKVFADAPPIEALPPEASDLDEPIVPKGIKLRDGAEIMSVRDQVDHFKGCVYIMHSKTIYDVTGRQYDKQQFDVEYGGYEFIIDRAGSGQRRGMSTSAWEAMTQNRVYKCERVDKACFRPALEPSTIVEEEGVRMVNTYVPIETSRTAGDVGPWLFLIERLLPDPDDREKLVHWMASAVQNPGVKFQWWPVLQGIGGNGKTTILNVVANAIGKRYSHLVNPEAMVKTANQFNGWVEGKLFIGFEEIFVGADRRTMIDTLKPLITNSWVSVERKGVDQYTADNFANGIMCTNHKDAIPVSDDLRRYGIFYTAQQEEAHLARDGLTEQFFSRELYPWLNDGGYACVTYWLANYPLRAELDPAKNCVRAPKTSGRAEAISLSIGRIEQEVITAIEEERQGFRGGLISSAALDALLTQVRARLPRNKRRDLMRKIGYDYHPSLPEGKTSRPVAPDSLRIKLYAPVGTTTDEPAAAVMRRYEELQVPASAGSGLRVA
jgi:hypothetical protein